MTSVSFHVNLADRTAYACRLLRKACAAGARVVVVGEALQIKQLDVALWAFSPQDFVPHAIAGAASPDVLARSPVVLAPRADAAPGRQVLVNLGLDVPAGFEGFERLIELVSDAPQDMAQARLRWKHYAGQGHSVTKVDQKESA